ncbi:hypothetical protein [Candidatus Viadribacter manganicus]|uniref:Uncharacterized protein n=1 Tax=Candidatus Viadribacter manganicus TaxID=1759059 RepID=A0A1B1AIN3_9PROT|nr:hypothetical protein [Candidatus Viadribacter manganicus]ANP46429.1 hypothetical protein ATE48_11125 [Candidatus Viadribacter manganicus]
MIGRLAVVALAVSLASCAGIEPAGRNARGGGASPTATASAPTPAPRTAPPVALLPPQTTTPAPQAATTTSPPARPPLATPPPTRQSAPMTASAPPPRTQPAAPPVVAAPQVTAPAPTTPAPSQPARALSPDDDIIVPGQVQTQVPAPAGDPRTNEERRADVRSWDQCITQVQGAFDSDPMSPQLTTPEEYCAQSLGMADRTSVPFSRQQRR